MPVGPDLEMTLHAYARGIFPMGDPEDGTLGWYTARRRGIIPLESFHVPRRLRRTMARGFFAVTRDEAFEEVVAACAEPAPGREETWITPELVDLYRRLHRAGFAHSVEVWREGSLAGGVFGVALAGLFAGESMFHRRRDASKVALVSLLRHLRDRGFSLLDTQFYTPHLGQFGAIEIDEVEYQEWLAAALTVDARF